MKQNDVRIAVFIDGSNLYFKLRDLGIENTVKFNYRKFSEWLARDRALIYCGYYIGVVRTEPNNEKGQALRKEQQRLFAHLLSLDQKFIVKRGYLMKNDGVYHEKGVDVQLAVDILVGAYEDKYDIAIIISSDTDLIPAIRKIKQLGKQVEYIGFAHRPSLALRANVTISRLLIKDELEQFSNKKSSDT
ncbi:MAG: NYN domain-containing protein [Patescibacteria group bacterium]